MSQLQYRPEDFLSTLAVASGDKAWPVLVGGQAVNFWAQLYAHKLPELQPWQPFLSKDCDAYGTREIALRIQEKSGWKLSLFPPREMAVATLVASDGRTIEVLNAVRGLTAKDFRRMCARAQIGEKFLWVLNPVALLKAKLANVAELDQAQRQDARHVSMLIPVVREFISQALIRVHGGTATEREMILLIEAALQVALSKNAKLWHKAMGRKFEILLPLLEMEASSLPKVKNFVTKRLPQILHGQIS